MKMNSLHARHRGLLLIVMVGLLTLLMILAVAFVSLMRLQRGTTTTGADHVRAKLLARTGLEYAVARLIDNPDPASSPEEDWTFRDAPSVPLETARNPSYNADPYTDLDNNRRFTPGDPYSDPDADNRFNGWSGRLRGTYSDYTDRFNLNIENGNAKIHVNGGVLDDRDRNGNGIPDHRDFSVMSEVSGRPWPDPGEWTEDGPNGFLARLLDNLEQTITGTNEPTLGKEVLKIRPEGGFVRIEDLKIMLGSERFSMLAPFLTVHAWVDPKVIKPQPVNTRPWRWLDIDEAHQKNGNREVTVDNSWEGVKKYRIEWKRNFVYAHRQLRMGTVTLQPRAPIDLCLSSPEITTAVLMNLKGSYLHVWDSNLGYDSGFGFYGGSNSAALGSYYTYPDERTTDSPWIRTRIDYGSPYGTADRPFYRGHGSVSGSKPEGENGGMLPMPGPIGELHATKPILPKQAAATADLIFQQRNRMTDWETFRRFIDELPVYEDVNEDGLLDGHRYVTANGLRKKFELEDWNGNGVMENEYFDTDPNLQIPGMSGQIRGLMIQQKHLLLAMLNPCADLNDFNPDRNLWKWTDKGDVVEHTTEGLLFRTGLFRIDSTGRTGRNANTSRHSISSDVRLYRMHIDRLQSDFLRGTTKGETPYPLVGGLPLQFYPEPANSSSASETYYDGQIGLGSISAGPAPFERFRDDLWGTEEPKTGSSDWYEPDYRGPYHAPLVTEDAPPGNWFADGLYSERDATLKIKKEPIFSGIQTHAAGNSNYSMISFSGWIKPNWFPEAATRPHTLLSYSPDNQSWPTFGGGIPVYDGYTPFGCYYVPGRNNQGGLGVHPYAHSPHTTQGQGWEPRVLLYGFNHHLVGTGTLNHRGLSVAPLPPTLEKGKWIYLSLLTDATAHTGFSNGVLGTGVRNSMLWLDGIPSVSLTWLPLGPAAGTLRYLKHIKLGEIAAASNMNYTADATFAGVSLSFLDDKFATKADHPDITPQMTAYWTEQARLGRFFKERKAWFRSAIIGGARRLIHRQINLVPVNDPFTHPTQVELEILERTQAGETRIIAHDPSKGTSGNASSVTGDLLYRVVFSNRWTELERLNRGLKETPYLDEVSVAYVPASGLEWMRYSEQSEASR